MEIAIQPDPREIPPPFRSEKDPANAPQKERGKDEDMNQGFWLSVALHIAIALLILFQGVLFPGKPIKYIPSLRVDLVGLPDQLKKEVVNAPEKAAEPAKPAPPVEVHHEAPPAPAPKVKEPVEQANPNEMVLHPKQASREKQEKQEKAREKRLQGALARIKALADISDTAAQPAANAVQIKGNKISKGTSLSSDAQESDKANYIDSLQNALQQNWTLPMWLERQELNAKVLLLIDSGGHLIQFKFVQSSGNPQFDDAVKRTLMESQPFPAPPADVSGALASRGVLVGFPL